MLKTAVTTIIQPSLSKGLFTSPTESCLHVPGGAMQLHSRQLHLPRSTHDSWVVSPVLCGSKLDHVASSVDWHEFSIFEKNALVNVWFQIAEPWGECLSS